MVAPKASSRGAIRWRATPEQLMILEELFKGGMKSPSALQVQKITAKLKEHGKVESKNVFYWFQNHKAREKQKLRRKIHTHKDLVYYNFHPQPQFPCGFWPMFPAQVIKGQRVSATQDLVTGVNINTEETQEDGTSSTTSNESPWVVTWLPINSDSDHHRRRPLKTLQLFPTTTTTTTETTTTAITSSTSVAATSATSSMLS